jgi:hypothetical protein
VHLVGFIIRIYHHARSSGSETEKFVQCAAYDPAGLGSLYVNLCVLVLRCLYTSVFVYVGIRQADRSAKSSEKEINHQQSTQKIRHLKIF